MGSTQSAQLDPHNALREGVLADYETIYNYFDADPHTEQGTQNHTVTKTKNRAQSTTQRKKRTVSEQNYATYGEHRRKSRSLYEETLSSFGAECNNTDEREVYHKGKQKVYGTTGEATNKVHFKKTGKLNSEKKINAELMARNAETQLREMEKKKYTDRISKSRRSKSLNEHTEPKQPLNVDTQSAEYWQKRRQLEKVLKLEEANRPADKKKKTSRKKEMKMSDEIPPGKHTRERLTKESVSSERVTKRKDRQKANNCGDNTTVKSNEDKFDEVPQNTKRQGRAAQRNAQERAQKSRSRSVKSDSGANANDKNSLAANTKTEAELLEELRQDDDKPVRATQRHELVSQHVPHYALPTKKLELKTDGRLTKLYVPKKPQFSSSEWPEDLDRNYCKIIVETFKDMYHELISDPNWVYNQRKSYLNFLNTAEWQEMDLKLAKMSFQQLLQEDPLQKMHAF